MNEHKNHLIQVLDILRSNKLFAKRSKCEFFKSQVEYFGHLILKEGILVDIRKVKAIREWIVPRDKSEVRTEKLLRFY